MLKVERATFTTAWLRNTAGAAIAQKIPWCPSARGIRMLRLRVRILPSQVNLPACQPLLGSSPFPENNVHFRFIIKGSKNTEERSEVPKNVIRPDPERLTCLHTASNGYHSFRIESTYLYHVGPFISSIKNLKLGSENAVLVANEPEATLAVVETHASEFPLLNQNGRPVAFSPRTLSQNKRQRSSVEKEAHAIVEALKKWKKFVSGKVIQTNKWPVVSIVHVW